MTKEQLEKFIKIRNRSDFQSNIQFSFDLHEAGLTADDLGDPKVYGTSGYIWQTAHGDLIEENGVLRLVASR